MKVIAVLLSVLFLFGCKSNEMNSRSFQPEPNWVSSHPIVGGYYIGVYGVKKTNVDYRNAAKNGALENMASEISIEISGESVLHTAEINGEFDQEFQQSLKFSSKQSLSGYELVDTWESATEYWVYYRLSKSEYLRIKKEKEVAAINIAKDYFSRAKSKRQELDYRQAFTLCIQGLESLSDYLDQPLQTEYEGRQVYMATEILSFLQNMVGEIRLVPSGDEKLIKLGTTILGSDLYVDVVDIKQNPLAGVPLLVEYKALFLKKYNIVSDLEGRAGINLGLINQSQINQFVFVHVDFEELAKKTTRNRMISALMKYLPSTEIKIALTVSPPSVFIISHEKSMGRQKKPRLSSVTKQALLEKGFLIASSESSADLIYNIHSYAEGDRSAQGTEAVVVKVEVMVHDSKSQNLVFSDVFYERGLQMTVEGATDDAMGKAELYMKRRVVPKLANQFFSF